MVIALGIGGEVIARHPPGTILAELAATTNAAPGAAIHSDVVIISLISDVPGPSATFHQPVLVTPVYR
jgi:hypothetical protein